MPNPARILERLRRRPTELSFDQLKLLLVDLGWSVREGKGSHVVLKSPRGFNITAARKNNQVKQVYLDMILKEIDKGEGD